MSSRSQFALKVIKPVLWLPVLVCVNDYLFSIYKVEGQSMYPALNPDSNGASRDWVLASKRPQLEKNLTYDDVVICKSPMNAERRVIKRIKGLPHDIIETRKPDLIIKGKNENWHKIIRVPNNHIWITGDRNGSTYDSSMFGPVSMGLVEAKVLFVIWPLNRFGTRISPNANTAKN